MVLGKFCYFSVQKSCFWPLFEVKFAFPAVFAINIGSFWRNFSKNSEIFETLSKFSSKTEQKNLKTEPKTAKTRKYKIFRFFYDLKRGKKAWSYFDWNGKYNFLYFLFQKNFQGHVLYNFLALIKLFIQNLSIIENVLKIDLLVDF